VGALGGGWTIQNMPTPKQTVPFSPFALHSSTGDVHEP
jgi:multidrug efflux system outer membrane protein